MFVGTVGENVEAGLANHCAPKKRGRARTVKFHFTPPDVTDFMHARVATPAGNFLMLDRVLEVAPPKPYSWVA